MRHCSSLHDFNLLELPRHFCLPFFFNLSQISFVFPHPSSFLHSFFFFFLVHTRYRQDNLAISVESLPLSPQCSVVITPVWACLPADLSKHKRYEIRLSVYNAVGEGPISAPQEVFVGEAGMCPLTLISPPAIPNLTTCYSGFMPFELSSRSSPDIPPLKCDGSVLNGDPAGCDMGPSSA